MKERYFYLAFLFVLYKKRENSADHESHAGSDCAEIIGEPKYSDGRGRSKWIAEKRKLEQKVGDHFSRPAFSMNGNQTKSPTSGDGCGMHEGGPLMIYVRGGADTMGE